MKKVVIAQPWASMIAAGLIDIFDLGVDLGTEKCHVLIVAAPWQKYDNRKSLPLEWLQDLSMARLTGSVPHYEDMPFDCAIGTVWVYQLRTTSDSVWSHGGKQGSLYLLSDARMFTQPVRTNIVDESYLPSSCKVLTPAPVRLDDGILIHVNATVFEAAREGYYFTVPMVDSLHKALFSHVSDQSLQRLVLSNNFRYKTFAFERDNDFILSSDVRGIPKRFYSIVSKKSEVRPFFKFYLRKQL